MSTNPPGPADEEALRAAYEQEIRRVRVEHVLLDNIVTLINLGMRRSGLMAGTETERDPAQLQIAIDAVRAQLPLLERVVPDEVGPIRDALAQLQLAYVQIGGGPARAAAGAPPPDGDGAGGQPGAGMPAAEPAADQPPASKPGEPGPAQRSGRLWIPGQ